MISNSGKPMLNHNASKIFYTTLFAFIPMGGHVTYHRIVIYISGCYKWPTSRETTMAVVQINVPYPMLLHRTDFAVKNQINPEIYFSGDDLDQYRDGDIQRLSEILHQHHWKSPSMPLYGPEPWRGRPKSEAPRPKGRGFPVRYFPSILCPLTPPSRAGLTGHLPVKGGTLDRFSKVIELARFFKPKSIVFHPGYEKWKFDGM